MAENVEQRPVKLAAAHHAAERARAIAGRTSKATPSFLRYLLARFQSDGCTTAAAALGYTSLLAIVPMLTIALAMFAAFPFFADMRGNMVQSLFANLAPSLGATVNTYLNTFMDNAGKATGAGVVGLAVTAILLINTIQTAFDRIFGSTSRKTQWNRFPIYWALLTLGPILFGVSFSISTYFFQMAGKADFYGIGTGVQILGNILPFVLEAAGFALFYRLMPTRPVLIVDAIWGGLAAAFLFEVVKRLFGLYLTYAPTYQALYGALAAIPIFMVWMYVAWVITLFGAEITAALPEWRAGRRSFIAHHRRSDQLSFSLGALTLLRQARSHGVGVRTQDFVKELHADPVLMHALLEQLQRANIIAHSDRGRWVLTRDLSA
ncbi:MAG TPA: YihY family inner membrane protein, partial [Reyranella sp.]|nr:YihY family inner membrane protein [Reyranella sp.]